MPHRLTNGLRAVVEARPGSGSVAVRAALPFGSVLDPPDLRGAAQLAWTWAARGAGGRNARERQEAFADAGVRADGGVGRDLAWLAAEGTELTEALSLLAPAWCAPHLDDAEFPVAVRHASEAAAARAEVPEVLVDVALSARVLAPPYDRDPYGEVADLQRAEAPRVRAHLRRHLHPAGGLVIVTGDLQPEAALRALQETFGAFRGTADGTTDGVQPPLPPAALQPASRTVLPDRALRQTHLGVAWPLLPAHDPRAAAQALGMAVLAEGGSSRLFTRLREHDGLAYAVQASAVALPGIAWAEATLATAHARSDRAEAVLLSEVRRLAEGVSEEELVRARALLRTREAERCDTAAGRADAILRDLVLLGRSRSPAERDQDLRLPGRREVREALQAAPCLDPTVVRLSGRPA